MTLLALQLPYHNHDQQWQAQQQPLATQAKGPLATQPWRRLRRQWRWGGGGYGGGGGGYGGGGYGGGRGGGGYGGGGYGGGY